MPKKAPLLLVLLLAGAGVAQSAPLSVLCTNPVSGALSQINIDYDKNEVDAFPARITREEIRWRDPSTGSSYTLDRATGGLTMVRPSSTGGYFLQQNCKLDGK